MFAIRPWPKPSKEESQHNNIALVKDFFVFTLFLFVMFYASSTIDVNIAYDFPSSQVSGSLFTACIMIAVMFVWVFEMPIPTKSDSKWDAIGAIGHASFYSLQALFLQTAYTLCKAYAMLTGNTKLLAATYRCALWTTVNGTGLTVLFFGLMWFQKKWQKEIGRPMEKTHPGASNVMFFVHLLPLFVAFFDIIFLCDTTFIIAHGAQWNTVVQMGFMYAAVYLCWCKFLQYKFNCFIYPFIRDITNFWKLFACVVIMGILTALNSYVLNYIMMMTIITVSE